jgi:hypothetical protein
MLAVCSVFGRFDHHHELTRHLRHNWLRRRPFLGRVQSRPEEAPADRRGRRPNCWRRRSSRSRIEYRWSRASWMRERVTAVVSATPSATGRLVPRVLVRVVALLVLSPAEPPSVLPVLLESGCVTVRLPLAVFVSAPPVLLLSIRPSRKYAPTVAPIKLGFLEPSAGGNSERARKPPVRAWLSLVPATKKAAGNMSSGPPGSKLIAYELPRPGLHRLAPGEPRA